MTDKDLDQILDDAQAPKGDVPNPNHRAVKLRNGTEEFYPLVATMMMLIRRLVSGEGYEIGQPLPPVVLYELVAKARDRDHQVFSPDLGEYLTKLSLFENAEGSMHDSTRNIVVSCFDGSDLMELVLVNPLHDSERS